MYENKINVKTTETLKNKKMRTEHFHFFLQYDLSMSLPEIAQLNKLALPNGEGEDDYKKHKPQNLC